MVAPDRGETRAAIQGRPYGFRTGPLSILILAFAAAYLISWIPHGVDVSYPAYVYSANGEGLGAKTAIEMKGKLYRPLLGDARYGGSLAIEYYGAVKGELQEIVFHKDWQGYGSVEWLWYDTSGALTAANWNYIGSMAITGNADAILIYGVSPQDVGKDAASITIYIAAPAQNLEEAQKIVAEMRPKNK